MKLRLKLAAVIAVLGTQASLLRRPTMKGGSTFKAKLTGYEEASPVTLSTSGTGTFKATLNRAGDQLSYTISYTGPFDANPAGGTVTSLTSTSGRGRSVGDLCVPLQQPGQRSAGTPACPTPSGTVSGTITAAQVIGPAGQGIQPGEFTELVKALRLGFAYANVHTTTFPAGEIRVRSRSKGDDENDDHHGGKGHD